MRARIWGCRGSLATPGPDTVRYGGNTSCIELRLADGSFVILDAGTGIRELGRALGTDRPSRIDLLLTHLHLDHLEGLPFFAPVWEERTELHIWGPPSPVRSLEDRIAIYFSPPLLPVHLSEIPARLHFHDATNSEWHIGSASIVAHPISHPGPTVGYRLEEEDRVFAYLTDHEPALGTDLATASPDWISGFAVARGADVVVHDCQYTEDEYAARVGWGHSSTKDVVTFAQLAKARELILFHHDPMHADGELEQMLARVRELWGDDDPPCRLAHEGMEFDV